MGIPRKERQMQIRKGIFETNSSSTHSISIDYGATEFVPVNLKPDQPVVLTGGNFGWDFESITDWEGKANYAFQYASISGMQRDLDCLRRVIEDYTGHEVILNGGGGFIDHQSQFEGEKAFESYETLKKFIFGAKSELIIDNDNH